MTGVKVASELRRATTLGWLQVLRGIAALAVVVFHFKDPLEASWPALTRLLNAGSMGVDIFFILSGFIICYSTQSVQSQQAASFVIRRFSRIALPAWVAMVCMLLAKPPYLKDLIYGFLFILPEPSPPPGYGFGFLIVAWTLTYELYFYGMFAIAIALGKRLSLHRAAVAALLMLAVMLGLQAWFGGFTLQAAGSAQWRALPAVPGATLLGVAANPMILEFMLGVGLALVYQRWLAQAGAKLAMAMASICLVGTIVWVNLIAGVNGAVDHGPLGAAGPSLLIVVAALALQRLDELHLDGQVLQRGPGRLAAHLGDASYSLYLLHPVFKSLLLTASAYFGWVVGPWMSGVGIIISIAAALVFYRWVEVPSQNLGRRWARRFSAAKGSA